MIFNLYKHTSRSYFDVYNALVTAYPRKPTWIFKELAGLFDFSSELMNRVATDILYPVTREGAYAFAATCDYEPTEADGATDSITFTLTSAMAKTLPIGYQVGGFNSSTGVMVIYELTEEGNSGATDTIVAAAQQKIKYTDEIIGVVDDTSAFADYPIDGFTKIIRDTAYLRIDSLIWTRVDNFDDSTDSDRHFQLLYQSKGKSRIRFGNGTTGKIPPSDETIYMTFEVTEGLYGMMDAGEITVNIGGDSDVSSLTNAGSSGGNDAESVASIIRNARARVRLRDMVWTQEDLETAARVASSSVQKAHGITALGSAIVEVIPSGGGAPGAGLLSTVETYVQSLTQFGVMPVTAQATTLVTTNVTATVTIRSGYVAATVRNLTEFAMTLATSSYDNQVLEYYDDNGADSARGLINTLWPGWAFTEDENDAIAFIIEKWEGLLGARDYREWGQDLEVGDLWIMGNDLYDYGVDIFTLTAPAANVTADTDEIIDTGSVTVS